MRWNQKFKSLQLRNTIYLKRFRTHVPLQQIKFKIHAMNGGTHGGMAHISLSAFLGLVTAMALLCEVAICVGIPVEVATMLGFLGSTFVAVSLLTVSSVALVTLIGKV